MVALFVVLTFILFIVVDVFVVRAQKKKHPAFDFSSGDTYGALLMFNKKSFHIPSGIILTRAHTWLSKLKDGSIKIGIDELIIKALGKVQIIPDLKVGSYIEKGDSLFKAQINGKELIFKAPVEGTLIKINDLEKKISDPYSNDWIYQLIPSEDVAKSANIVGENDITKWIKNEFRRLKEFIIEESSEPKLAGVTMYDGGNIVEGAVSFLGEEALKKFEQEFLKQ